MSYTPTEWKTGDVITADKLNNMEQGIVNAGDLFVINATNVATQANPQTQPTLDKTYEEISDAIQHGKIPVMIADAKQGQLSTITVIPFVSFATEPANIISFGVTVLQLSNSTKNINALNVVVSQNSCGSVYAQVEIPTT